MTDFTTDSGIGEIMLNVAATPTDAIFVMRHGQTALDISHRCDSWLDLPLSDEGREDVVTTLSDHLKDFGIQKIFVTSLKRIEESGHIISTGLPTAPPVIIDDTARTWNLGTIGGDKKDKERKAMVKDLLDNPEKHAPGGGESYGEFTERFDSFLDGQMKAIESGKLKGPVLDVLSGSNCRRIGERFMDDRDDADLDEGGLLMLYRDGDEGKEEDRWKVVIISGASNGENYEES
jgi:broad specificity phosphatase PhoE